MPFFLKEETHNGQPCVRIYERTSFGEALHEHAYFHFVLTRSGGRKGYVFVPEGSTRDFFVFNAAKGKMKLIYPSFIEKEAWLKEAQTPKKWSRKNRGGFGSRGLRRRQRLMYVKGSQQAARLSEYHRQKVAAGTYDDGELEEIIVDRETLDWAQGALEKGQSFVLLPQEVNEPVKNNVLLPRPSLLNGKTCDKISRAAITKGHNTMTQMNDTAFSYTGTQAAMMGCNAFTHAVESGVEDGTKPKNSWEWLHVRGKQMGGDFHPNNLVAGTYQANSRMIPFENAITAHARWFASQATNAQFSVQWTAYCEPANSHVGKWILVEWAVNYGSKTEQDDMTDAATYKPFTRAGRYAFDARRETAFSVFDQFAFEMECKSGFK